MNNKLKLIEIIEFQRDGGGDSNISVYINPHQICYLKLKDITEDIVGVEIGLVSGMVLLVQDNVDYILECINELDI